MNKFFKKGMTLGELCLVFAIMGVVASMTLIAAKPYDKSIKYAYEKVYSTLNTAFYNAQLNLTDELRADDAQFNATSNVCNESNEDLCIDGTFPMNSYTLCYMLTQYINTSQSTVSANCNANAISVSGLNPTSVNTILASTTPHITASNGVKYWIVSFDSSGINKPINGQFKQSGIVRNNGEVTYTDDNGERANIRFYGIVVDINGSMGPNTTSNRSNKQIADTVAFIILDTGDIIPIGQPLLDKRYITANVIGPNGSPIPNLPPLSIYQAVRIAWATDSIQSSGSTFLANVFRSADNPLSLGFFSSNCVKAGTNTPCIASENNNPFFTDIKTFYRLGEADQDSFTMNLTYETAGDECKVSASDSTLDPTACYVKINEYY